LALADLSSKQQGQLNLLQQQLSAQPAVNSWMMPSA
jgi:hypothetical protein